MTAMEIVLLVLLLGISLSGLILRTWLKTTIEQDIKHPFDRRIEEVRAEFRRAEEELKGTLRQKETEISALRDSVLNGSANRQAMADKRRLEAIEKLWNAVIYLGPYKNLAATYSAYNVAAVSKRIANEPKLRQIFEMMTKPVPEKLELNEARYQRPFVTPIVWAYYAAYESVVVSAFTQMKLLAIGVDDIEKMYKREHLQGMLKAVLPHHAKFIEGSEPNAYYHLLDELEGCILGELGRMLDGQDIDQERLKKSASIMEAVNALQQDTEKARATKLTQ